jgi:hypothetical protein
VLQRARNPVNRRELQVVEREAAALNAAFAAWLEGG